MSVYISGVERFSAVVSEESADAEQESQMKMVSEASNRSVSYVEGMGHKASVGRRISLSPKMERSKTDASVMEITTAAYTQKFWISRQVHRIVEIPAFEQFFQVLIVVNALEMGFALAYPEYDDTWILVDLAFAASFLVETMIFVIAYGHALFFNFWHCLQFCATLAAIGDCYLSYSDEGGEWASTSAALKSTRLLLLAKLFSMNRGTRLIVYSMARSLTALRGVLCVILVICYGCTLGVYATVGTRGEDYDEEKVTFGGMPHRRYFGSITQTMLTLFIILILSEWDSVARGVYEVQPYMVCFFVGFTVLLTFGLMNVLVGIIVDTVNAIHRESEEAMQAEELKRQKAAVEAVVEMVFGDDDDITLDEFLELTEKDDQILELMSEFKVPHSFTFGSLFSILDDDRDGRMSKDELSCGLFSLMAGGDTARFCIADLHVSRCHYDVVETQNMVAQLAEKIERLSLEGLSAQPAAPFSLSPATTTAVSRNLGPKTVIDLESTVRNRAGEKSKQAASNGGLWSKCYSDLYDVVQRHCKEEMDRAWEDLQKAFRNKASHGNPEGPDDLSNEEHFVIRKKIYNAVCQESSTNLKKALDHATLAGMDSALFAMELTYNDALKRFKSDAVPTAEVKHAMESGDWSSALDMTVQTSLAHGADKNILAHLITRVSPDSAQSHVSDWNGSFAGLGNRVGSSPNPSGSLSSPGRDTLDSPPIRSERSTASPSSPLTSFRLEAARENSGPLEGITVQGRAGNVRKFREIRTKAHFDTNSQTSDAQLRLLSILHSEASKHTSEEMRKAWGDLQTSAKLEYETDPFLQTQQAYHVYNLMQSAIQRKSFSDLQRALHQAIVAGLDIRDMDAEVAYRDALARFNNKNTAYTVRLAVDAFRRKEWYLALDLILQVSLARGADRLSLFRTLTKIYADTQQTKKTIADTQQTKNTTSAV